MLPVLLPPLSMPLGRPTSLDEPYVQHLLSDKSRTRDDEQAFELMQEMGLSSVDDPRYAELVAARLELCSDADVLSRQQVLRSTYATVLRYGDALNAEMLAYVEGQPAVDVSEDDELLQRLDRKVIAA